MLLPTRLVSRAMLPSVPVFFKYCVLYVSVALVCSVLCTYCKKKKTLEQFCFSLGRHGPHSCPFHFFHFITEVCLYLQDSLRFCRRNSFLSLPSPLPFPPSVCLSPLFPLETSQLFVPSTQVPLEKQVLL